GSGVGSGSGVGVSVTVGVATTVGSAASRGTVEVHAPSASTVIVSAATHRRRPDIDPPASRPRDTVPAPATYPDGMRSLHVRPAAVLPGGTGREAVAALLAALPGALAGSAPAVHPVDPGAALPPGPAVPPGVAAVVRTSGSTSGTGHLVALDGAALVASARATHERLAGPGQWVACLPSHHIAGLQVLVRSVVAGTEPVVLNTTDGFRATDLAAAVGRLRDDVPGYLSLVPTQLARVLADDVAVAALRRLSAILVGGARTAAGLLAAARDAGLRVVTTYGMTETGGGCVYDGVPLPGVAVDVDAESRVWVTGPVLARGYLDDPAADRDTFHVRAGRRWLRTADRGSLAGGVLTVLGRLDDVILSGGLNVSAAAVEQALGELPGL